MSRLGERLRRACVALHTIRVRLTLWYVALLAVILVGVSAVLYLSLSYTLYAELDHSLAADAQQVVSTIDVQNGEPGFGDGLDTLTAGTIASLYDRSGQRFIASNARQPLPVLPEVLAAAAGGQKRLLTVQAADGERWRVLVVPVVDEGQLVGVLQVERSERGVEVALSQLVIVLAVVIPATLILAIAGGLFLAGRALGPIDRVTRAAASMSAEDLSRRLNMATSADEVGRLATTFDQMLERLDAAFQRQRQFTADASHELRTPLAILMSEADLALKRPRTPAHYRHALATIRANAAHMARLLDDLLALARADAGQERFELEPLALQDLRDDVLAAMAPLAQARGVALQRGADEPLEPISVEGDQTRLTQLLVNLIDNGLRHTPAGGAVTVSVRRDDGRAVLKVADTGVGIPPEHLPRIFERFYRVDAARSRADGGAGLGLAICQWIARAHGGEITVESWPGRGTTFTVCLPLASSRGGERCAHAHAGHQCTDGTARQQA